MSDHTDISICNYGLSLLGIPAITSFDEESDAASTCSNIYPILRDSVLADFNWRISVKKRALAKIADETPLNEWGAVHSFPSNMLEGPLAVFGDGSQMPSADWEIYEGKLYSNFDTAIIDFIARPDESLFPPLLVDFLGHALAASAALPLTESADRADILHRKAYGPPQLEGNGGLYVRAKRAVSQSQSTKSIFKNGDPLTAGRF